MKANLIAKALVLLVYGALVGIGYVASWLWDRRWQALAGLVVFIVVIAASHARPGPWWGH